MLDFFLEFKLILIFQNQFSAVSIKIVIMIIKIFVIKKIFAV